MPKKKGGGGGGGMKKDSPAFSEVNSGYFSMGGGVFLRGGGLGEIPPWVFQTAAGKKKGKSSTAFQWQICAYF